MLQYQMPRPMPPILGGGAPASAQTYVFPVAQPDRTRSAQVAGARAAQVEAPKRLEGPPILQSYVFTIGQPQARVRIQIPRPKPPLDVIQPTTEVFKAAQPEAWVYQRDRRFATEGGSHPPIVQAAAAVTQSDIFKNGQPELSRWTIRALRDVNGIQNGLGSAPQTTGPDTDRASYIFPVNQPDLVAWARPQLSRREGGPTPQREGSATAQTYEYTPNQPSQTTWALLQRARGLGGPTLPSFGATNQQTYEFAPNQPERLAYDLRQRVRTLGGTVLYPLDTFATLNTATVSHARVTSTSDGSWRTTSDGILRTTE